MSNFTGRDPYLFESDPEIEENENKMDEVKTKGKRGFGIALNKGG